MKITRRRFSGQRLALSLAPMALLGGALTGVAVSAHASSTDGTTCSGTQKPASLSGHVEGLLANASPAPGSSVSPGGTISLLYTDEQPIASSTASITSPTVTIDGQAVTATVTATSGQTPNYINPSDGGSRGTQCQDIISFQVPSGIGGGSHTITVTGYDSDNDRETVSWTVNVSQPPTPKPGIITSQSITPNDEGFVVNGEGATGTMTFKLFRPGDKTCSKSPVFSQTVQVHDGIADTSNTSVVLTRPGTYRWMVTYSGDSTHKAAQSPCGVEQLKFTNNS